MIYPRKSMNIFIQLSRAQLREKATPRTAITRWLMLWYSALIAGKYMYFLLRAHLSHLKPGLFYSDAKGFLPPAGSMITQPSLLLSTMTGSLRRSGRKTFSHEA